jgi:hypothetical protein
MENISLITPSTGVLLEYGCIEVNMKKRKQRKCSGLNERTPLTLRIDIKSGAFDT